MVSISLLLANAPVAALRPQHEAVRLVARAPVQGECGCRWCHLTHRDEALKRDMGTLPLRERTAIGRNTKPNAAILNSNRARGATWWGPNIMSCRRGLAHQRVGANKTPIKIETQSASMNRAMSVPRANQDEQNHAQTLDHRKQNGPSEDKSPCQPFWFHSKKTNHLANSVTQLTEAKLDQLQKKVSNKTRKFDDGLMIIALVAAAQNNYYQSLLHREPTRKQQ